MSRRSLLGRIDDLVQEPLHNKEATVHGMESIPRSKVENLSDPDDEIGER